MISTDMNLNNPTKIIELDLQQTRSIFYVPEIISISRDQYHALKVHDIALYVIKEFPHEIYYGDSLLSKGVLEEFKDVPQYMMKYDYNDNEFIIYINRPNLQFVNNINGFSEVERHKSAHTAINMLMKYNSIGFHNIVTISIYESLKGYIHKENDLNQTILGIISNMGYKETPEFQMLTSVVLNKKYLQVRKEIFIAHIKTYNTNHLFDLFVKIYDVFDKYNFFTDDKYNPDKHDFIDLKKEITDIIRVNM